MKTLLKNAFFTGLLVCIILFSLLDVGAVPLTQQPITFRFQQLEISFSDSFARRHGSQLSPNKISSTRPSNLP